MKAHCPQSATKSKDLRHQEKGKMMNKRGMSRGSMDRTDWPKDGDQLTQFLQQLSDWGVVDIKYDAKGQRRYVMPPHVRELLGELAMIEPDEADYATLKPDKEDFEAIVPGWVTRYGYLPCQVLYSAQLRKYFRLRGFVLEPRRSIS